MKTIDDRNSAGGKTHKIFICTFTEKVDNAIGCNWNEL